MEKMKEISIDMEYIELSDGFPFESDEFGTSFEHMEDYYECERERMDDITYLQIEVGNKDFIQRLLDDTKYLVERLEKELTK